MRSVLVLTLLFACGGQQTAPRPVDRSGANPPWVAEGGCLPKTTAHVNCVTLTIADAAQIREALLAHIAASFKDMRDDDVVKRLVATPLAQWTTLAYRFRATHSTGVGGDSVELEAFEEIHDRRTGFRAHLVRHEIGWTVHELAMFAEHVPQPL